MSKLLNFILILIDFIIILFLGSVIMWWKDTHMEPGLSEMLNIKLVVLYLLIAVGVFVLLILKAINKINH